MSDFEKSTPLASEKSIEMPNGTVDLNARRRAALREVDEAAVRSHFSLSLCQVRTRTAILTLPIVLVRMVPCQGLFSCRSWILRKATLTLSHTTQQDLNTDTYNSCPNRLMPTISSPVCFTPAAETSSIRGLIFFLVFFFFFGLRLASY